MRGKRLCCPFCERRAGLRERTPATRHSVPSRSNSTAIPVASFALGAPTSTRSPSTSMAAPNALPAERSVLSSPDSVQLPSTSSNTCTPPRRPGGTAKSGNSPVRPTKSWLPEMATAVPRPTMARADTGASAVVCAVAGVATSRAADATIERRDMERPRCVVAIPARVQLRCGLAGGRASIGMRRQEGQKSLCAHAKRAAEFPRPFPYQIPLPSHLSLLTSHSLRALRSLR